MAQRTLYLSLLLLLFMVGRQVTAQTTTMFNEEKFSFGFGAGTQYSFLGVQGKYFFSDYVGLIASTTYSPYGQLWNGGIEIRIPDTRPGLVAPYFLMLVGTNSYSEHWGSIFDPLFSSVTPVHERKKYIGITIGSGIKWDAFKSNRGYFKIGFNLRFINGRHIDFIESFNTIYLTNDSTDFSRFLPSIGYTFCIGQ